jgi:hypothetical protein
VTPLVIRLLQQIVRLLKDLQAALRLQSQPQPSGAAKQKNKGKDSGYTVQPTIRSILDLPPGFIKEYEASEKKSRRLQQRETAIAALNVKIQKRIALLAFGSVIAGVLYAAISATQWYELRKNFRIDERAWIGVMQVCRESSSDTKTFSIEGCGVEDPQQPTVTFKVVFKNFGKTAAIRLHSWISLARSESELRTPEFGGPNEIYPPGVVFNSNTLPLERSRLGDPKQWIYVYGKVWYDDTFHAHHWMTYCFERHVFEPANASRECTVFNDCDDCGNAEEEK